MPHLACSAGSRANAVLVEPVERGLLAADEYARMMIPTWNRTLAEFLAPLRAEPLVSDRSSVLSPGSRSREAVTALMAEFRTRLAARVAADPGAVETHWHVVLLRIARRGRRDDHPSRVTPPTAK
ncbi:hypothetical protein ACFQ7M_18880 [Streptomyces massasporeus]